MNQQEQIAQHKKELRTELKRRRQSVSATEQHRAAEHIARSAIALAKSNEHIGIYHALPNEVSTKPLVQALWNLGSKVYLPRIRNDRLLHFCLWERNSVLTTGKLGIPTPANTSAEISAENLNLVFMPLLGFDSSGRRLGMGGGYYDTSLSNTTETLKVGLAFDCQEVQNVPVEEHDIRLDLLVTESRVLRFQ